MGLKEHYSIACILVMLYSDLIFKGIIVNGQVFKSNEADSSPSKITAIKGSSVWLHWKYTYVGGRIYYGKALINNYIEQIIGFNSASQSNIQALAKRTGQNGVLTLESSIPAQFNGRIEVISSNNTLVIHDLQYNDSSYQFSSNVKVAHYIVRDLMRNPFNLRPIVTITIYGIPSFRKRPTRELDVNETSHLQLKIEMDGNPQPYAEFKWSHLSSSSARNVTAIPLYPFVYTATYSLHNINWSYCGRMLQITVKNRIGSSSVRSTNVTVLLTLDKPFDLQARKNIKSKCVEVKWSKAESGACFVKYDVKLKNVSGNMLFNKIGYNIDQMSICNLKDLVNVINVELNVSFKNTYKTLNANVSDQPVTFPSPTTAGISYSNSAKESTTKTVLQVNSQEYKIACSDKWKTTDSLLAVGIVILIIIIIILLIAIVKLRRKPSSDTEQENSRKKLQPVIHYMDLQVRSNETESNYAKLQGEYEVMEHENHVYVNQ